MTGKAEKCFSLAIFENTFQHDFEDSIKINKKQKGNEGQSLSTANYAFVLFLFSVICINYNINVRQQ